MTYRRTIDSDTWHWRIDCSGWPAGEHLVSPTTPYYGVLCLECKSKDSESSDRDESGSPRTGSLRPAEQASLSAHELEKIRDEMRRSGERVRGDLERLESLIILARAREGSASGSEATSTSTALVGFISNPQEPPSPPPPREEAPARQEPQAPQG